MINCKEILLEDCIERFNNNYFENESICGIILTSTYLSPKYTSMIKSDTTFRNMVHEHIINMTK